MLAKATRNKRIRAGMVLKTGLIPFTHYGIVDCNEMVIHTSKRLGKAVRESYANFAKGRVVRESNITSDNPYQAAIKAESYLDKPYHLIKSNCEHLVRDCHGLGRNSHQLQKYAMTVLTVAVASQIPSPALRAFSTAFSIGATLARETEKPLEKGLLAGLFGLALHALFK